MNQGFTNLLRKTFKVKRFLEVDYHPIANKIHVKGHG